MKVPPDLPTVKFERRRPGTDNSSMLTTQLARSICCLSNAVFYLFRGRPGFTVLPITVIPTQVDPLQIHFATKARTLNDNSKWASHSVHRVGRVIQRRYYAAPLGESKYRA